ncbi:hypothetical protein [Azotobacter armeniacus]
MPDAHLIPFTDDQLVKVRTAGQAFRRLSGMTAESPDWSRAYAEWQAQAEEVAVLLIAKTEEDRP